MRRVALFDWFILFFMFSLICVSCSDDEPEMALDESEDKIEYYVKYESAVSINSSASIPITIKVNTEKGKQTLSVPRTWEGVFGPFNDLTELYITLNIEYSVKATCRGRISICRGNQPFILKADQSFNGTSYTIKYVVVQDDLK